MNIEGMRHAEVVALIKRSEGETWLLVVDPETDEHFKRMGVIPTTSHVKGRVMRGDTGKRIKSVAVKTRGAKNWDKTRS